MTPRPATQETARNGPQVRLSTVSAVVGLIVVAGGFIAFLLTTGARGGEASSDLRATKEAVAAVATKQEQADARVIAHERDEAKRDAERDSIVAVHGSQIEQITKALQSIDRKLERVIERLPPPAGK